MADRTVFVDGTTSGTPGTNGAHYASLSAAISGEVGAAPDLVAGAAILTIECSGNVSDTTAVDVTGFTSDSTHYVKIVTPSASRHAGTWDGAKYRLEVSNPAVAVLRIRQEYTRVEGLQIRKAASNANDQMIVQVEGAGTSIVHISDCIIRNVPTDAFRAPNIWVIDADVTAYIWNNIIYGQPDFASVYATGISVELGNANLYSNTVIGGFYGLSVSSGCTVTAKNNYFAETATDGSTASINNAGTFNDTTNAVSDGSTLVGASLRNIAHDTTTFTNVTPGSENYHLPVGSPLINVGTDTSGESAPLNFTTDIDRATRSGTWDIGADELTTSSTPAPSFRLSNRIRPNAFAPGFGR